MSTDNFTDTLIARATETFSAVFNGVIELAPQGEASVWVDGRAAPPVAMKSAPKKHPADCVWRGAPDTLLRALESEKALESAYLSGRLFISGDMSLMARLSMAAKR